MKIWTYLPIVIISILVASGCNNESTADQLLKITKECNDAMCFGRKMGTKEIENMHKKFVEKCKEEELSSMLNYLRCVLPECKKSTTGTDLKEAVEKACGGWEGMMRKLSPNCQKAFGPEGP